jgi:thiol-disulfide isomerase/thioredoxin
MQGINVKRSIWLLLLSLFWSTLSQGADESLDWNEAGIAWQDYEEGLAIARKAHKSVLLVFYANWCHTCHSYRTLFHDSSIETLAKELVMIRVNAESRPDLNALFSADGLYLPRSFGLSSTGEPLGLTSGTQNFRYFYSANNIAAYGRLMRKIVYAGT